ncbi:exocyst complex component exo84 [Blyttiomyces sp. JEL0837]|nr:exocyst complex component exo84 [Blyttiomyces sp. JEL0837]
MPQVDVSNFAADVFSPDQYLQTNIADCSEFEVKEFRSSLQATKDAAAGDLQKNVHRNYSEFVAISKEISNLERDLLSLRGFLNELTSVNEGLKYADKTMTDDSGVTTTIDPQYGSIGSASKLALYDDSSTAHVVKADLTDLYDTIEGLQKVLPPSKSRTMIRDGSSVRFWEVGLSNYKPKQAVYIYVLSDALLITVKKKNLISGKARIVLERCFRISEIAIIDMKDSSDVSNAFKIMSHPDVFVFKSESGSEKRNLLALVKRLSEEAAAQKKRDHDPAPYAERKTEQVMADNDSSYQQNTYKLLILKPSDLVRSEPQAAAVIETFRDESKTSLTAADKKWVLELNDELEVSIHQRQFDDAVDLILKAQALLAKASPYDGKSHSILLQVDQYAQILSEKLCQDMSSIIATRPQVQANISRLIRLGHGNKLREVGLDLSFVLGQLFHADMLQAIEEYRCKTKNMIAHYVDEDTFEIDTSSQNGDLENQVSKSVLKFYDLLIEFGADMGLIISISIRFERSIPELQEHQQRLEGLVTEMHVNWVSKQATIILETVYNLDIAEYSSSASILEMAQPSDVIIKLLGYIDQLISDSNEYDTIAQLTSDLISKVISLLNDDSLWSNRRIGFGGVQQLVLDIHFFLKVTATYITNDCNTAANLICERALRLYFAQNPNIKAALKGGEWYERRVEDALRDLDFRHIQKGKVH